MISVYSIKNRWKLWALLKGVQCTLMNCNTTCISLHTMKGIFYIFWSHVINNHLYFWKIISILIFFFIGLVYALQFLKFTFVYTLFSCTWIFFRKQSWLPLWCIIRIIFNKTYQIYKKISAQYKNLYIMQLFILKNNDPIYCN